MPDPTPDRPTGAQAEPSPLHREVSEVIERIRPAVQADGGDVELVKVTDEGEVWIRFHGACVGCPSSTMTLKLGIERNLKDRVKGVTGVRAVD